MVIKFFRKIGRFIQAGFSSIKYSIFGKKGAGRGRAYQGPRQGAPAARSASVARRGEPSYRGKKKQTVFADKKRFFTVISVVAAAVLVPVIVVAAVSGNMAVETPEPSVSPEVSFEEQVETAQTEEIDPAAGAEVTPDPLATPDAAASVDVDMLGPAPVDDAPADPADVVSERFLILIPENTGSDVVKLQQRLMELHYMDNDEPTEYYGAQTQEAVKYFQRSNGLDIDGACGIETQKLLFSSDAKSYLVKKGYEGLDVEAIQARLQELSYPVSATGFFGDETESAVKYFQRMNGLTDDGIIGADTKEYLNSENAEPAIPKPKAPKKSGGGSKGGGGGGSTSYVANPGSVEAFIAAAQANLGKPYRTAGKGPDTFDCSGFVYYALKMSGNGIGYMTSGDWAGSGYPTIGSIGELQRGDIICFRGHVGIYLGGGTMIDASSGNGCVVQRSCTGGWSVRNFICGKRPL